MTDSSAEDLWADDELDGPAPLEVRTGRRSRFKFAMTPQWIMLMTDLPHPAFRLYCILQAHANAERGDNKVWPFQKTLAELMGYSRRASIDPLVKALQERDLVDVAEIRYGQNNSRRRFIYTVHEEPAEGWEGLASIQEFYAEKKAAAKAARKADSEAAPASSGGAKKQPSWEQAAAKQAGQGAGRNPGNGKGARLSKQQAAAVRAVEAAFPEKLRELLPSYRPPVLRDAILQALDSRSAEQLVERVQRRWWDHGYAAAALPGGKGLGSPVGVAIGLVRPSTDCPDVMCEDSVRLHTGEACPACGERRKDRKAGRGGNVPEQRSEPDQDARVRWECRECRAPRRGEKPDDGLCPDCQADAGKAAEAARKLQDEVDAADARRAEYASRAWEALLTEAYDEHGARERRSAERRAVQEVAEQQRLADKEETRRIREQMARDHPELAEFAQA